jgi:hypothetical protein
MPLQKIDVLPDFIKAQYDRLFLISDFNQDISRDINPARDLIVTTNWLLWQKLVADRRPCLHLDYGLVLSPIEGLTETIFIQSNDWLFQNGDDPTHFHGVSLGRKMLKEISVAIGEFERIYGALKALVKAFNINQIIFVDLRTTHGFLDSEDCISVVTQVAHDTGCDIQTASSRSTNAKLSGMEYKYAEKRGVGKTSPRKSIAARLFSFACALHWKVFRHLRKDQSHVLLLHSQLTSIPLLSAANNSKCQPMMLASWYPEKRLLGRLVARLFRGVILIPDKNIELSDADKQRVADILAETQKLVIESTSPRDTFIFGYIRKKMLTLQFLETLAKDVLYAKWVIDSYRPAGISTDGMQNTFIQNFLERAMQQEIKTISTWHAPLIHYYKLEIFGCDQRIPRLVDTVLTWGIADEGWLKAIGAQSAQKRAGHILSSHLLDIKSAQNILPKQIKNVLVLQYTPQYDDFETLSSVEYEFFVSIMTSLTRANIENIIFKLHPGHNKVDYYETIVAEYGFKCQIVATGPFKEYVKWADVVIGPAFSGTMLEVIAAGKVHLPVLLPPHPIDMRVFKNGTVFENLDDVTTALRSRQFPNQTGLLKDFCSLDEFKDPAGNAWVIIEEHCSSNNTAISILPASKETP